MKPKLVLDGETTRSFHIEHLTALAKEPGLTLHCVLAGKIHVDAE